MNTQQTKTNPEPILNKQDELILVVKREKLLDKDCWQGLKEINSQEYLSVIDKEKEFLPRSLMETDPRYKQIIPYLIFTHDNKLFLMQRQAKISEQRLKNKYSLGIGGHIRKEDLTTNNIVDWSRREFQEEVNFHGSYQVKPLGILNDDSNPVGQVHIGFVFLLIGDSSNIKVKSELKSGELLTIAECQLYYESMESWSQMVFDFIKSAKII